MLDGVTNGAIYALLALATVLVFAVTRIIFIPQGEFVAYGALTMAGLQLGHTPGTIWFLLAMALAVAVLDLVAGLRAGKPAAKLLLAVLRAAALPVAIGLFALWAAPQKLALGWQALLTAVLDLVAGLRAGKPAAKLLLAVLRAAALPVAIGLFALWAAPQKLALGWQALLTLAIVTPMGPLVYRLAYQSLADASVLVLLIVSVGVHFALTGLGLVFFGPEGSTNPSFWDASFDLGPLTLSGQTLIIIMSAASLIVLLWLFFEHSLYGKALRATAVNRLGARLMGISSTSAGQLSFLMAAFIGALSGLLISTTTTINYDSGFLIGLKGFVAAVFAGLASYPAAAVGALLVGLLESFSSFWASAFKEVIVFTSILPVLLWRSLRDPHKDEE
ncbi:branched-chain amino acid ABC transporter permease [Paucibacter sp. XJ19-41]|nr:branched-chain amino acid ABC transporter permease [Paucibacter sp. XJ19-41]MDC6168379.1 branched-chain amino acid ABC transporter permease [Paucibacter sp. XJ19-41]